MIVFRRRLIFWLIKEYFKKWRKAIFFFFIVGFLIFFLLRFALAYFIPKISIGYKESIGIAGAYTIDSLPQSILQELSHGLTYVSSDGIPHPDLAKSWKILENGKTYIFTLRENIFFNDGTPFTSDNINYNFSDTTIEKPDPYTLVFKLKDRYSPFFITVSRPVFTKNFVGVGDYTLKNIEFNGNFIASMTLVSAKNPYKTRVYHFYPSLDSLKTAFVLGEISSMRGLSDFSYKKTSFMSFPNVIVEKKTDDRQLVTLFYNVKDPIVSDEKLRNALSFAIPDKFSNGVRNYGPFSPNSWAYTNAFDKVQDIEHAKLLIATSSVASSAANLNLAIKTFPKYKSTAETIIKAWQEISIKAKIEEVNEIPNNFQVFLGDFYLSKDPDQYTLWHRNQESNISHYESARIDKFLEDGRTKVDMEARKKIYMDFQKYLLNDSPATFLYFPYEYDVKRK